MGILDRIKAASMAFRFPANLTHRAGSFLSIAPRTFPYENTDPISNSAVINTLAWIQRNFLQGDFDVYRDTPTGGEEIEDHPLEQLLYNPNQGYGADALWAATLLSYHLDGNAYWLKERNARGFGVPTALWYEPHWSIKPHYPEDGSAFIDYYERRINGNIERIPVENVVHFRNGLNPANPRYGLAPLKAAMLQVFTDTEVSLWVAALCRNMAIPGVILSPSEPIGMGVEKAEQIKQTWKRKFGGDNRGEPLILDFSATVQTLGYNPEQMNFGAITNLAESRISGALGIPAIVAGLSAGLDSSTYNNLANLKKSAFEECLIPTWMTFAKTLTRSVLVDFERDVSGIKCKFDTSEIRALQENQSEKEQRAIAAWLAGVTTLNEARQQFGYNPDPAGDYYLQPNAGRPTTTAVAMETAGAPPMAPVALVPQTTQAPTEETAKGIRFKAVEWNGMTLRRQPTPLEERMLKALDDAYQQGRLTLEGQLLALRGRYIDEIIDELSDMSPDEYAAAVVETTDADKFAVGGILSGIFTRGARLIVEELRQQGVEVRLLAAPLKEAISRIAGAIVSKIANDVQSRATGAAISGVLVREQDLPASIRRSFDEGSTSYVSRGAAQATNWALSEGREAEIKQHGDEISYLVYSAVLDNATCRPCGESDGLGGQIDEIPPVPNPDCEGMANCRCVHIPVVATGKGLYRGVEVNLKPTAAMKEEAQRGLDWRKEFGRGGTAVGIARARDISNGKELSADTVKRMYSFFSRHEVDKEGEGFSPGEDGYPSNGRIAWALWGGDPGYSWSRRLVDRFAAIDED